MAGIETTSASQLESLLALLAAIVTRLLEKQRRQADGAQDDE
jgi:hypothetical protein